MNGNGKKTTEEWLEVVATHLVNVNVELAKLGARLDETNAKLDQTNAKLDQTREQLSARIDQTNAKLEQTNAKLEQTNAKLDQTRTELREEIAAVGGRVDQVRVDVAAQLRISRVNDRETQELRGRVERIEQHLQLEPGIP